MKELSIEEKAYKAYTELINRLEDVKNAIKKQNYGIAMDILYKPYPEFQITTSTELKESEDEKTWLINYLSNRILNSSIIAEKENLKKAIAWLEKMSEQKPNPCDGCINRKDCINCENGELREIEYNLTPKVLFKKGDWVVSNRYTSKPSCITKICDTYYLVDNDSFILFEQESDWRLWTIQDAKDGDVLNSTRVQATIIFKGFADDGKHILAYCALQKGIFIKQEMLWDRDFEPCPKNWNDELFSKMKESGYEWNSEKKELKKIEQNMELTDFESALFTAFSNAWQPYLLDEIVNVARWAKEHSQELLEAAKEELKEQKPTEWSEEDEDLINYVCSVLISNFNENDTFDDEHPCIGVIVDKLKSLHLQKQWNPNKTLIDSLGMIIVNPDRMTDYNRKNLKLLYEQLKAL